jgi:hypothetical protein
VVDGGSEEARDHHASIRSCFTIAWRGCADVVHQRRVSVLCLRLRRCHRPRRSEHHTHDPFAISHSFFVATGEDDHYMINVKQIAKFVVALGDKVAPTDIEEGMRVGCERNKYTIQIPLPPRIDPTVTMMQVRTEDCLSARLLSRRANPVLLSLFFRRHIIGRWTAPGSCVTGMVLVWVGGVHMGGILSV